MLTGDAVNTDANRVDRTSICHRCWNSPNENNFVGGAPCTGTDTVDIPADPNCKMIRQTIIFPTLVISLNPRQLFLLEDILNKDVAGAGMVSTLIVPTTSRTSLIAKAVEVLTVAATALQHILSSFHRLCMRLCGM